MLDFIDKIGWDRDGLKVIGSYGWFMKKFLNERYDAIGVERSEQALEIGKIAYGLKRHNFFVSSIGDFLINFNKQYDIGLFLSMFHYYVLDKQKCSGLEIVKKIYRITKKILFLDMGQNHEEWLKGSLTEWSEEHIEKFIMGNTFFKKVFKLGKDLDDVKIYSKNYGRILFACIK